MANNGTVMVELCGGKVEQWKSVVKQWNSHSGIVEQCWYKMGSRTVEQ